MAPRVAKLIGRVLGGEEKQQNPPRESASVRMWRHAPASRRVMEGGPAEIRGKSRKLESDRQSLAAGRLMGLADSL